MKSVVLLQLKKEQTSAPEAAITVGLVRHH
jgi:hypothetical protein